MKHRNTLSMVLLTLTAIAFAFCQSVFALRKRESCHNSASTVGTHADGIMPNCLVEATFALRYLLCTKGSAANGIIVNTATTRPYGVVLDEPTYDSSKVTKAAVHALGAAKGTVKMICNAAFTALTPVYTAAAGKVSPTPVAGCWLVGLAVNATTTTGDEVEVVPCAPRLAAVPVTVAAAGGAVTAEQALAGAVVSNLGASGAVAFTLPAAVPGMRVTAIVQVAQELQLDPNGTETIALPSTGVQGAAGKYLTANALTETVQLICLTAGTWDCITYEGTWTAQG